MLKQCIKCGEQKPLTEFNFKNKLRGRRNARCRVCTRKDIMNAYYKKRAYYLQYRAELNHRKMVETQTIIFRYLSSHPCVDCGINDVRVLQFDHVRGVKKIEISKLRTGRYPIKTILEEIEKCEIRCANCHSRKTAQQQNWYHRYPNPLKIH